MRVTRRSSRLSDAEQSKKSEGYSGIFDESTKDDTENQNTIESKAADDLEIVEEIRSQPYICKLCEELGGFMYFYENTEAIKTHAEKHAAQMKTKYENAWQICFPESARRPIITPKKKLKSHDTSKLTSMEEEPEQSESPVQDNVSRDEAVTAAEESESEAEDPRFDEDCDELDGSSAGSTATDSEEMLQGRPAQGISSSENRFPQELRTLSYVINEGTEPFISCEFPNCSYPIRKARDTPGLSRTIGYHVIKHAKGKLYYCKLCQRKVSNAEHQKHHKGEKLSEIMVDFVLAREEELLEIFYQCFPSRRSQGFLPHGVVKAMYRKRGRKPLINWKSVCEKSDIGEPEPKRKSILQDLGSAPSGSEKAAETPEEPIRTSSSPSGSHESKKDSSCEKPVTHSNCAEDLSENENHPPKISTDGLKSEIEAPTEQNEDMVDDNGEELDSEEMLIPIPKKEKKPSPVADEEEEDPFAKIDPYELANAKIGRKSVQIFPEEVRKIASIFLYDFMKQAKVLKCEYSMSCRAVWKKALPEKATKKQQLARVGSFRMTAFTHVLYHLGDRLFYCKLCKLWLRNSDAHTASTHSKVRKRADFIIDFADSRAVEITRIFRKCFPVSFHYSIKGKLQKAEQKKQSTEDKNVQKLDKSATQTVEAPSNVEKTTGSDSVTQETLPPVQDMVEDSVELSPGVANHPTIPPSEENRKHLENRNMSERIRVEDIHIKTETTDMVSVQEEESPSQNLFIAKKGNDPIPRFSSDLPTQRPKPVSAPESNPAASEGNQVETPIFQTFPVDKQTLSHLVPEPFKTAASNDQADGNQKIETEKVAKTPEKPKETSSDHVSSKIPSPIAKQFPERVLDRTFRSSAKKTPSEEKPKPISTDTQTKDVKIISTPTHLVSSQLPTQNRSKPVTPTRVLELACKLVDSLAIGDRIQCMFPVQDSDLPCPYFYEALEVKEKRNKRFFVRQLNSHTLTHYHGTLDFCIRCEDPVLQIDYHNSKYHDGPPVTEDISMAVTQGKADLIQIFIKCFLSRTGNL